MLRHLSLIFILFFFSFSAFSNEEFSFYNEKESFLPVEKAFQFSLLPNKEEAQFEIVLKNAPGYYTYKQKLKITLEPTSNIVISYPQGKIKEDEFFGEQEVYYGEKIISIKTKKYLKKESLIKIDFQGCSEKGLCYPPSTKMISLNAPAEINYLSETDTFVEKLTDRNFIVILTSFFIAGLLLSLTPCVLPMVPILSSIVISSNKDYAIRFTLSYVAGVSATYVIFGVAASMTGSFLSASLQNIYFLMFNSFLFIIFALAMFDVFHLSTSENTFLSKWLNKINKKSLIHIFFLGLLSSLILSPCVAPPLAAAILYIGQANDILLGALSLFVMSIGMSVPLLLIGFSANKLLPKPGIWMVKVKKLIGFILIGMAIYIVRPMLDESIFFFLLNSLLTSAFIYYLFFTENSLKILKLILMVGLILSSLSNVSILKNILDKEQTSMSLENKPEFIAIHTVDELNNFIASNTSKAVMLDFYADWCIACLEFEKFTFTDVEVGKLMEQYVLLKVDVTKNTEAHKKLLKEFELFGPPAIIFFDSSGNEIRQIRTIGFKNAEEFKKILQIGLKNE